MKAGHREKGTEQHTGGNRGSRQGWQVAGWMGGWMDFDKNKPRFALFKDSILSRCSGGGHINQRKQKKNLTTCIRDPGKMARKG